MIVSNYMHKALITVTEDTPIKKVLKLIFSFGISGVPVVKNKKLVGIVTEADVMSKLFPSVAEFMEDFGESRDFESMEKHLGALMNHPTKEIMNTKVRSATKDTPLLRAQSLMLVNRFSHLPVVNDERDLIGIISQGDIFRALVGTEIPFDEAEDFRDWLSQHYDLVETWGLRLSPEVDSLVELFKKNSVKTIADVVTGTGEHPIALAKKGFHVIGFDRSRRMINVARQKYLKLPQSSRQKLGFVAGDYLQTISSSEELFDAVICMGNGLPYDANGWKQILAASTKKLSDKGIVVLEIRNFKKNMIQEAGFVDFSRAASKLSENVEYAFTMFYGAPPDRKDMLTATMSIHKFDSRRWIHAGINSIRIAKIRPTDVVEVLRKLGFKNISLFGSLDNNRMFEEKFDDQKHDWLNVVAKR